MDERNPFASLKKVCCYCNNACSGAYQCRKCSKPCHAIAPCSFSTDDDEGFGAKVTCCNCWLSDDDDDVLMDQNANVVGTNEVTNNDHDDDAPIPNIINRFKSRLYLCWCGRVWMDNELTTEYLDKVFGKTFFGGSRLLIWDSFRCHISVDTKDTLRRLEIHSAVVPGGTTKFIQAPDVCWNAPFKNAIREKYNDWMVNGEKPTTSTGNLKAPPMDIYLEWIASAWESIPKPLIEDSFLTCGITKKIDGRHDEKIHVFKKDGAIPNGLALLKQRRKEDAVIKGVEEIDLGEDESDPSVDI
ncbi:hypothetical protein niasHT_033760 [Heterodera trifolii]|uniref:DDE-1 domain-containing protein n=1 Tax=Heterodera trifolii TaxID=157864 RepID=A0ABD2J292_9BILA